MTEAQPLLESARRELATFGESHGAVQVPWLKRLRRDAAFRLDALGLPGAKNEAWKYTSLQNLASSAYRRAEAPPADAIAAAADQVDSITVATPPASRLVFLDGHYVGSLSTARSTARSTADRHLPEGVKLIRLRDALAAAPAALEAHLGHVLGFTNDSLVALNTGFLNDGVCLTVADGVSVEAPLHLVFATSAGACAASYPRSLIVLGRGADATVVESYVGTGASSAAVGHFTNAATEVVVGQGARLAHHKLQLEGGLGTHVGNLGARLRRDSIYESHTFSLGAALARNEIRVCLAGEGASCQLSGLYVVRGRQHVDNHLLVDHAVARGSSAQLWKGIVDERATGVFSGKVRVAKDAQKCDARQLNRNLLLSESATANTRPTLEILADDVKCSHGVTIGRLDEEALFYMRSRGIDADEARRQLTFAFAGEVIEQIRAEPVRTLVAGRTQQWLSQLQRREPRREA